MKWLALLRGINVGGNNIIPMAELRSCLEALGFTNVVTYIQSGNVIFEGPETRSRVVATLERALNARFAYDARLVLLSAEELGTVVREAPPQFGSTPDRYRYDVIFLRPPLVALEVLDTLPLNPVVDACWAGAHAVYYRRLIARATQSRLSRVVQMPVYKEMTIRNWNTTSRLAEMAGQGEAAAKKRVAKKAVAKKAAAKKSAAGKTAAKKAAVGTRKRPGKRP